jgi:predicted nucleic acid-binding protein
VKWVVDASVAAKWLAPEPESALADALLGHELIVPDLLFAEVANILWKKQQRAEMTPAAAQFGARWLLQLPLAVHEGAGLMIAALDLAARLRHPAYDCFYLALAHRSGCAVVTADRRLVERMRAPDAASLAGRVVWLGELATPAPG